jgi:signal transduction histidine kinase
VVTSGAVAPLLINNAGNDPRFHDHPGLLVHGIESYIAVPLHRMDGSLFGTLCALDPLPATLSEEDFAIFRLLSQLIAFELEAEETRQKQEAQMRSLEDFISIAAHDLRQPLTVLYGNAQLLSRGIKRGDMTKISERTETLLAQTRRAIRLSDLLLDIARIEAGNLVLTRASFDLADVARQVADDIGVIYPQREIIFEGSPKLRVYADEHRLAEVLHNLLNNAVKYAPEGPVALRIETAPSEGVHCPDDAGSGSLLISVIDHGPGVDPMELTKIFERRYRAGGAMNRGISGSGLGLYIAGQIAQAHGGTMWAESTAGGGLTVRFTLPCSLQL